MKEEVGSIPELPGVALQTAPSSTGGQDDGVTRGLAFLDGLSRAEEGAFLALFAGARFPWTVFDDGRAPFIGKAECELVEDWRSFYSERLPAAGLFFWQERESGPALGMVKKPNGEHHTWTKVHCGPTELGYAVRQAWWERWNRRVVAATPDPTPPSA